MRLARDSARELLLAVWQGSGVGGAGGGGGGRGADGSDQNRCAGGGW